LDLLVAEEERLADLVDESTEVHICNTCQSSVAVNASWVLTEDGIPRRARRSDDIMIEPYITPSVPALPTIRKGDSPGEYDNMSSQGGRCPTGSYVNVKSLKYLPSLINLPSFLPAHPISTSPTTRRKRRRRRSGTHPKSPIAVLCTKSPLLTLAHTPLLQTSFSHSTTSSSSIQLLLFLVGIQTLKVGALPILYTTVCSFGRAEKR
jgi:hypothetical protein